MTPQAPPAGLCVKAGIAAIIGAMAIAPFLSHPEYSSLAHTTSELGGQSMPNAWIMNGGFLAYGLGVACGALSRLRKTPALAAVMLLFAGALAGTAVFSAGSAAFRLPHDPVEDALHSFFSGLVGTAFALACAIRLFAPGGNRRDRTSWLGLVASAAVPLAMTRLPGLDGLLQRGMFAISFVWFWREFSPPPLSPPPRAVPHSPDGQLPR